MKEISCPYHGQIIAYITACRKKNTKIKKKAQAPYDLEYKFLEMQTYTTA